MTKSAVLVVCVLAFAVATSMASVVSHRTEPELELKWTPQDFISARPMQLKAHPLDAGEPSMPASVDRSTSESAAGKDASDQPYPGLAKKLFDKADVIAYQTGEHSEVQPFDFSSHSNPYTSSRVFPDAAVSTYPYRTVVKIFFRKKDGSNWTCSGSLIKRGVVATAGHCIHPGNGNADDWFHSYVIVPAYNSGSAPYGSWSVVHKYTTNAWYSGGGGVPNAGDYGFLVLNLDSNGKTAGHYTGYLGYTTSALAGNHVTSLGYPGNFDSGSRMHQVSGQTDTTVTTNTIQMGSDMRGGSSGGPWVQNFHVVSTGQTPSSGSQRIVGITSYGPVSTSYTYQGSSIPNSSFSTALNDACTSYPNRCT